MSAFAATAEVSGGDRRRMAAPRNRSSGPLGVRAIAGLRATAPIENTCCEKNPWLQLQGGDTSDGAVFSVQHLFCSFDRTQFCASHSEPLGASLYTTVQGTFG